MNPRQAAHLAEVEVVEAELAAGERENERVHRRFFDQLRVVIPPRVRAVAAADEQDPPDLPALHGVDHRARVREHRRAGKAGRQHVPAVDAAHAAVVLIAAELLRLPDEG